ncbi:DUF2812 domain-containing protein [Bacillus sp. 1P06AnD]|uniref:DUF2812 domain-containing protein n=1 Tax=Bacillus sp. 1P06AnD TaxID=3132208 RepID=UPI0039A06475
MTIVVRKLFVNFEKEERWINEMSAKGLHLKGYSIGRYVFEEGEPGKYIYRFELLTQLPSHPESKAYIRFMEEMGIECVYKTFRWVCFRKKAEDGSFDLYSDYDSRIAFYKRVASLYGILGGLNLMIAIINLMIGITNGGAGHTFLNAYFSILNWLIVLFFAPLFISYLRSISKLKKMKGLFDS